MEARVLAIPRPHSYLLGALWAAFVVCLIGRFGYVFYNRPIDHLFSDPNRHWLNGKRFFWPELMGSIDPLAYQAWLRTLQWLDHGTGYAVLAVTGMLSMALPFFYLKALREVLPVTWALAAAITIGFMPSLFMIYAYFMTETLLLSLAACGFWLTLRAMRIQSFPAIMAVALVWALAGFTRIVALPLAALCFATLARSLSWRKRALLVATIGVCFGVIAIPACWHSSKNLNFCAPFGSGYFNEIYRASSAKTMRMEVQRRGEWVFSSPSMYTIPLWPISDWHSARDGAESITINPSKGRDDWERTLRAYREHGPRMGWLDDKIENALMLFFDPSWPDSDRKYVWGQLNYWNRWLWLPLTFAVGVWMVQVRPTVRDGLMPLCALALIALLLLQVSGVMEGRYRKPAEPLLIAGAFILVYRLRTTGSVVEQNLPDDRIADEGRSDAVAPTA